MGAVAVDLQLVLVAIAGFLAVRLVRQLDRIEEAVLKLERERLPARIEALESHRHAADGEIVLGAAAERMAS